MSLSDFAQMLTSVYAKSDIEALRSAYLHRATRRHGGTMVFGREALVAAALEDLTHMGTSQFSVDVDLGGFVKVSWRDQNGEQARRHYWPEMEAGFIARETIVDTCSFRPPPPRHHVPLGELDAGRGQIGADTLLGFGTIAQGLHALWNKRALEFLTTLYHDDATYQGPSSSGPLDKLKAWRLAQFNDYPGSHVTFEREVVLGDRVALLWQWARISKTGVRDRVTGSTLLTVHDGKIAHEDTLIDRAIPIKA